MAGSSNKTHQRALAAKDISNDTEENHASRQLVGRVLVGTQLKFLETPTFVYEMFGKKCLIPVNRGLLLHDTLWRVEAGPQGSFGSHHTKRRRFFFRWKLLLSRTTHHVVMFFEDRVKISRLSS